MDITNGKLKFKIINYDCLAKDHKYIIIQTADYHNVTKQYTGFYIESFLHLTMWKNVDIILDYSKGVSSLFFLPTFNIDLRHKIFKIYELDKSNYIIQNAMEQRAINKIIQKIIGDACFTYMLS